MGEEGSVLERMMVQVWEPFLPCSALEAGHDRDYLRGQDAWRGEDRVWLLPPEHLHTSDIFRWDTKRSGLNTHECLIQGEQLNAYDLYQIDEQRHVYPVLGTSEPEQRWHTLPEGLYRLWLNASPQPRAPLDFLRLGGATGARWPGGDGDAPSQD